MTNQPTNGSDRKKQPSFVAYSVREVPGKTPYWHKIGAAFAHADTLGFTVQLDALPIGDRVVLRIPSVTEEPAGGGTIASEIPA